MLSTYIVEAGQPLATLVNLYPATRLPVEL